MDRDTFIIMVYCLVDDEFKKLSTVYRVRHTGFPPAPSDAEVITMEICGEYFKQQTDEDLFDYFAQHYRHFSNSRKPSNPSNDANIAVGFS